ncbi:thioesterase superfamily member 2 [Schistosoma japonicum]|nr:thioesterase superfamily member 2 [Schistosoma japonicum]
MSLNVVNQIISHLTSQGTFSHIFKGIQAFSLTENCLTWAVDFITSVDLMRLGYKKHVSVNLETSFINPGKLNSWIRSDSYILKKGKRLAFCEVKFVDERSGELVARGTHTKYIIEEK